MSIILDLIIVAIFVISMIITIKKGFVKSVALIASFLVAIFASVTLSGPISNFVYDSVIEPGVVNSIETSINDSVNSAEKGISDSIWQALPGFVKNSDGVSESDFNIEIVDEETVHETAVNISQEKIKPIAVSFVKIIVSLILFVVFSIACKLASKLLDGIFSISVMGKANRFLGGVLGFVNGAIYAEIFILLSKFLISITGGFLIFTNSSVNASYIFKFLLDLLPGIF